MSRPTGRKNNATVIREYLEKNLKSVATDDYEEMTAAMVDKAKDGSVMAYRTLTDNMNRIIELDSKENTGSEGFEVLINRDGVTIRGGGQGAGGVVMEEDSPIYEQDQFLTPEENPNIVKGIMMSLGGHTAYQVRGDKALVEVYKDYVGPLITKPLQHEGSIANHFETEVLYSWGGEVMGLADICRMERIEYGKVWYLIDRYEMDVEEAVQEVIDMTRVL